MQTRDREVCSKQIKCLGRETQDLEFPFISPLVLLFQPSLLSPQLDGWRSLGGAHSRGHQSIKQTRQF